MLGECKKFSGFKPNVPRIQARGCCTIVNELDECWCVVQIVSRVAHYKFFHKVHLVMLRAWLGLKALAWAWPERAWA